MQKSKFKIGDEVLVTAGKDKGRKGKIDKVFPREVRVRISGLNVYKRHTRGLGREKGGIIEFSRPLPVGSVALICPRCTKQTRIGYRVNKAGEKTRTCSKCKKDIDVQKKGRKK